MLDSETISRMYKEPASYLGFRETFAAYIVFVCDLMTSPGGGGGVHNMFRVWVCAAQMGGFLGPKFSKQGSLFRQIFHKQGWVIQKLAKNSKKWVVFRQKSS